MSKIVVVLNIVVLFIAPFFGSVDLTLGQIFDDPMQQSIFFSLRLPREVLAFGVGMILALSGLVYQSLFRNALLTPYTLGISSASVLGVGIALKLGIVGTLFGFSMLYFFGFFGALGSIVIILFFYKILKRNATLTLLLLGIALSFFYTAALMLVFYFGDSIQNDQLIRFSMGSLSVIGWREPLFVLFFALLFVVSVYIYRYELSFLALNEEMARQKGVSVERVLYILLGVSSFAIGVVISITGPIGFVGLVIPHITAKLVQKQLMQRIIPTALFGGVFLVFCDTLARYIQSQGELPIGVVTACIGAPFFVYLIFKRAQE